MTTRSHILMLGVTLALGACGNLTVPDYNAASVSSLQSNASAAALGTAAVGVLAASRDMNTSFLQSYVVVAGEQGREGINLDPSNGEDVQQALQKPLGSAEPNYAGWQGAYKMIRQANVLLHALDSTSSISDQQKATVRGFTQTMKALSFMRLNLVFSKSGSPVAVDVATDAAPPAIANDSAVKLYIIALLDSALTQLQGGSATLPFGLTSGFAGFTTASDLAKFNRALRARQSVYMSDWNGALQALALSFISSSAPLSLGVYDVYSLNAGDRSNPLYDPTCRQLFSISQNRTEAQKQVDGVTLDQRYLDKIRDIPAKISNQIPVDACFKMYATAAAPLAIIRNEELFLLRAEARLQTGDRPGALADDNFIRTNSGKLAAIADLGPDPSPTPALTGDLLLDDILYNRRYSLIWEQGVRWADARRYNFLAKLPKALPAHVVYPYFPLPTDECVPRSPAPAGCTAPTPF
jgi:hypothetical protein